MAASIAFWAEPAWPHCERPLHDAVMNRRLCIRTTAKVRYETLASEDASNLGDLILITCGYRTEHLASTNLCMLLQFDTCVCVRSLFWGHVSAKSFIQFYSLTTEESSVLFLQAAICETSDRPQLNSKDTSTPPDSVHKTTAN